MAADVDICNLAMQKLGAKRIAVLTEDSRNARSCNTSYNFVRDAVVRSHPWSFALKRSQLAPSATTPAFDFGYQFPLPADCLRHLKPNDNDLDWVIEGGSILTNDVASTAPVINLRYIARITDANKFDPLFIQAFAAALAWEMCEEITQSNSKKDAMLANYKYWIGEARKANAFEQIAADPPEDTWITAQL